MQDGSVRGPSCIFNPGATEERMKRFPLRLNHMVGRVGQYKPRRWAPSVWQPWVIRRGQWEWLGATRQKVGSVLVAVQPYRFGQPPILNIFPQWVTDMQRRKVPQGNTPGTKPQAPQATKLFLKLQNLIQQISVTSYDDGSERQPGILVLLTTGNLWRAIVKDPDTNSKLVATQETLDECLLALDLLLSSPDTMWEPDQHSSSGAKGKGRKK